MATKNFNLTAERVRDLFSYDQQTGILKRRIQSAQNTKVGDIVGSLEKSGYLRGWVDNRQYLIHRLIWLHVYGEWPISTIDHIDGNKSNNRIENLRDVPVGVNGQNKSKPNKNSSTGLLGVSWRKDVAKWCSQIVVGKTHIHLGFFSDPKIAHEAYLLAKRQLHEGCVI